MYDRELREIKPEMRWGVFQHHREGQIDVVTMNVYFTEGDAEDGLISLARMLPDGTELSIVEILSTFVVETV